MSRRAVLFAILTGLLICFIWGQSMLPRDISAGESSLLMDWLKPLLDPQGRVDDDLFHHDLRKCAHFTEYAALGFSMAGLLLHLPKRKRMPLWGLPAVLCVAVAAVDETIQLFSDGRGPKVLDVLLDSAGALCGIGVYLLLRALIACHNKKNTAAS